MFRCPKHNPALTPIGRVMLPGKTNPCAHCTDNYCGRNTIRNTQAMFEKEFLDECDKMVQTFNESETNELFERLVNEILEKAFLDGLLELNSRYLCAMASMGVSIPVIDPTQQITFEPPKTTEMKQEQVVHVCLGDDRHYYFGSVAAIFDTFTPDELGVSLPTLWNYGLAPDRPYKNDKCSIYRDSIHRKKQTK